jgi:hypothetical protein
MAVVADPESRALRGAISAAVRGGDRETEAELRRELALRNVERHIERQLTGLRLTAAEMRRLRTALDAHGPQRRGKPAEPTESNPSAA